MTIEGQIKVLFQEIVSSRDRLAGEVRDLQEKLSSRDIIVEELNDRITELEKQVDVDGTIIAGLRQHTSDLLGERVKAIQTISESSGAWAAGRLKELEEQLKEVTQKRDRLTVLNGELQAKLGNRDGMLVGMNDRITELEEENKDLKTSNAANAHLSQEVLNLRVRLKEQEDKNKDLEMANGHLSQDVLKLGGENQNLLRRIGEVMNSSTFKLQEENEQFRKENEALRKQVQTAEELLGSPEEQYSVVSEDPEGAKTVLIEAWLVGDDPDELRLMWATEKFIRKNWKFCVRAKDQTTKYDEVYFESYRMKVPYPR